MGHPKPGDLVLLSHLEIVIARANYARSNLQHVINGFIKDIYTQYYWIKLLTQS